MTLDERPAYLYVRRETDFEERAKEVARPQRARVSQKLEHIYRAGWPRLFYLDESRDHRMNVSVLPRQTINIKERPLFCQFALSCWPAQTHKMRGEFILSPLKSRKSFIQISSQAPYSLTPHACRPLLLSKHRLFPRILFIHFHSQQSVCTSYCLAISP